MRVTRGNNDLAIKGEEESSMEERLLPLGSKSLLLLCKVGSLRAGSREFSRVAGGRGPQLCPLT